jgi:polyisoprenoid-binding protein YceI
MRKLTTVVMSLVFSFSIQAAAWTLDKVHSSVQFVVSHLTISKVRGEFTDFDANLNFDGTNVKDGSVTFNVKATSISTGNSNRDDHLRSDDFFNAEQFPEFTFKSKQVVPAEGNKFKVVGDLTIRDVTKEVSFDCEFHGAIDAMGGKRAGFSAETTINRQEFNVKFDKALETGGLVVGNDVKVSLELEFVEKAPEQKG